MNTNSLRTWIIDHDNQRLFVVFYIGLAVVLSIWISLFWLVAIVAVHFLLELTRQYYLLERRRDILAEALWELKLDLALILFALALSLYMDLLLGAVSIGLTARLTALSRTSRFAQLFQSAARAGSRFAGWQRLIRGFLLSVDDLAPVARAASRRGKPVGAAAAGDGPTAETEAVQPVPVTVWGSWALPWSKGDWFTVLFLVICLGTIVAAPWLTSHTWETVLSTMQTELIPFPGF
jgi:hypothetical protein